MYFHPSDFGDTPPLLPRGGRETGRLAHSLGERLECERHLYKAFGPYWWVVKAFLKEWGPRTRAWFHGSWVDADLRSFSRQDREHGLGLAMRYAAPSWSDACPDYPGELHIVELPSEGVALYRLQDPDASLQLDLFDDPGAGTGDIAVPTLPQVAGFWRNLGDRALSLDDFDRAAWAYRRMLASSRSDGDTGESWLRLARCFQHFGHLEKAVFCYRNLQESDRAPWILGEIAGLYKEAGNWPRAFDWYRKALQAMPDNPEMDWGYRQAVERLRGQEHMDLARA